MLAEQNINRSHCKALACLYFKEALPGILLTRQLDNLIIFKIRTFCCMCDGIFQASQLIYQTNLQRLLSRPYTPATYGIYLSKRFVPILHHKTYKPAIGVFDIVLHGVSPALR